MDNTRIINADLELHEAFGLILSQGTYSVYITTIIEMIYNKELNKSNLEKLLQEHDIKSIRDIKEELLDLLIAYINIVLNDHKISDKEITNLEILKRYFKIKEGDFYKFRFHEIEEILQRQLEKIYRNDSKIDAEEAIFKVGLQGIFDLSYDQFLDFSKKEVKHALNQGANLLDLDTFFVLPSSSEEFINVAERNITQNVKDAVWNRDSGKCVICGSNKKIEFDHIIPFSMGGTNTYRNIQLLCEKCNRKKSNKYN